MCLTPVSIPNPYYGLKQYGYNRFHDCTSAYIKVGCGHCDECITLRQMSVCQKVQMEALDNVFFYATLTYNNDMIPVLTTSTGYDIRFADYHDITNMFKRLRKDKALFSGRNWRYFAVSELGSRRGRPHFHILFIVPTFPEDDRFTYINMEKQNFNVLLSYWSRNVGCRRYPVYKPCCTYVRYFVHGKIRSNYDFHLVIPRDSKNGIADCAFYVTKYMLKPSDRMTRLQQALKLNLPPEEYDDVYSMVKCRMTFSRGFGNFFSPKVRKHIREGIERYKDIFPYFVYVNPDSGQTFPLSRLYRKKFVTFDDEQYRFLNWENGFDDGSFIDTKIYDLPQVRQQIRDFRKHVNLTQERDVFEDSFLFIP